MLLQCLVPVIKNSELLSIKAEWFPAGSKLHLHLKMRWSFLLNLSQCLGFLLHANEDKLFCSCHIIYKKIKDYKGNLHQHLFSLSWFIPAADLTSKTDTVQVKLQQHNAISHSPKPPLSSAVFPLLSWEIHQWQSLGQILVSSGSVGFLLPLPHTHSASRKTGPLYSLAALMKPLSHTTLTLSRLAL